VEDAINSGDADWASLLNEKYGTPDFESMLGMEGAMEDIERQLDNQLDSGMMTNYDYTD
jgi:hypothetical protein